MNHRAMAPHTVVYYGALAQLRSTLNQLLAKHLRLSADGRKHISHATMADRCQFFNRMVRELHDLGYRLRSISHFKPKHAQVLMRHWESQSVSASTLQKRWSYLNLLCRWIGKEGMLGDVSGYVESVEHVKRSYVAVSDHSWTGQGADPLEILSRVVSQDEDVARVLCFQLAFGLRLQEASLFRPTQDDRGDEVDVIAGTKGGRPRKVAIETEVQRCLLDEAKHMVEQRGQRSLIPLRYDLRQWLNRCYTVFRRCGLKRIEGLVSHGARHQYANDLFTRLTGLDSPVRGGEGGGVGSAEVDRARLQVSLRLGHARSAIANAYLGRRGDAHEPVGMESSVWEGALVEQRALLQERLKTVMAYRTGSSKTQRIAVSAHTLRYRQRLLNQWVGDWMRLGCPLTHPDALSERHIDGLLALWTEPGRLDRATIKNRCQFLSQVCCWLDREDLGQRVKINWGSKGSTL